MLKQGLTIRPVRLMHFFAFGLSSGSLPMASAQWEHVGGPSTVLGLFHAEGTLVASSPTATFARNTADSWEQVSNKRILDIDVWNGTLTCLAGVFTDVGDLYFQRSTSGIFNLGPSNYASYTAVPGARFANAVYLQDGPLIWSNGVSMLFISSDHGITSESLPAPEPLYYTSLARRGDKAFLSNLQTGNIWRSYQGVWSVVANAPGSLLVELGDLLVASGQQGILKSSDEGDTWTSAAGAGLPVDVSGTTIFLTSLVAAGGQWFGIGQGALFSSWDAGETWAPLPALPFIDPLRLVYAEGYLYCGSAGAGVWRLELPVGLPGCTADMMMQRTAYPDPAIDQVSFIVPDGTRVAAMRVLDTRGRQVMHASSMSDRPVLSLEGLQPGLYQAVLLDATGTPLGWSRFVKAQ